MTFGNHALCGRGKRGSSSECRYMGTSVRGNGILEVTPYVGGPDIEFQKAGIYGYKWERKGRVSKTTPYVLAGQDR